jgi:S-DNA-T family DNA segregation ATPase FtsK/SpoIIIE
VVSDSIRANTNLRIALRVQQPGESEDVIDDPGAARISKALPGRALARTGHGELTEFQSAYVGGRTLPPTDTGHVVVSDLRLDEVGDGTGGDDGEGPTDLQRIVAAISEATARAGIAAPSPPWLEQLGDVIGLDALSQPYGPAAAVALGIVDEPARQRQTEWGIDLERDGSVLVFGTGATGKTTLLRTVAVALARRGDPRELHLYGLDFAGHGLSALEALPHVGSVIGEEDEERVTRLLTTLRREIDARGRLLAAHGVSTLSALHAVLPAGERPPRIVVLLDSYPGFLAAFDTMAGGTLTSLLPRIIGDGRAAGIHVIATADRRIGVPSAVHAVVTQRIVLRLTDDDEYASFGLDRRATEGAHLPAGRGFVASSLEVQTAIVGSATGEAAAAALAAESAALTARWGDARAPAIAGMPVDVPRSGLPPSPEPARPVIGIEERDLGPAALDLREASVLVAGPYRSGRTTALRTIVAAVADAGGGVDVHVLAPRRSTLADLPGLATVARGAEACAARAAELAELVQARSPDADHPLVLVVIDDGGELAEGLAAPALETIARRGRDVGVRLVVACESQQARGFAAWLRELRKDGHGVLLDPNLDLDGDLLGVRLPRRTSAGFPPGRGYLVAEGVAVLVQLARDAAN